MADLEEQLAQLKLMNSRTLSPKPCNTLQGFAGKKIGPAVPPKPKKPQPLIPKSSAVKKSCEPSYSTMLQQSNGHPLYHHRAAMGKDYSNMKMTLDNPAILEQQREALEHHKRMLDAMKGPSAIGFGSLGSRPPTNCSTHDPADKIYENQKMLYENTKPAPMSDTLPAPDNYLDGGSGGSLIGSDEGQRSGSSSRMDGYRSGGSIYSNVPQSMSSSNDDGGVLYGNMAQIQDCGASVDSGGEVTPTPNSLPNVRTGDVTYCNINYGGNYQDDLPPPPPLDLTAPSLSAYPHTDYFHETSEEELPPPPSPVSSSYSELRRANDNLSSDQPYTIYNHHQHVSSNGGQKQQLNMHGMHHHHHMIMDSMSGADANSSGSVAGGGGSSIIGNSSIIGGENSVPYPMSSIGGNDVSGYKNDYGIYGSQTSSTYESIYEPINPRPPSQLSSRSNYSLYSPYISGGTNASTAAMQQMHHQHGQQQSLNSHKEAEVKILTDLLVQSMDNGQDVDHYGMCVKCGDRVVGESSGCTAMDQIYHIDCFTCCQCQINLQGKPFYALEGKPYCEEDYLNTLEKCSVCMKPILERILRATGKPYHPVCFCCIVCGKSLDGIPFTVDATNQIHCIEDFHKKFAPRCCVCCEPIMPGPGKEETVRVVALDRSFHISCYKCEDCGLLLSSEAEGRGCYPLDDHVLCKSCNAKQVQALTIHMTTEL